MLTVFSIGFNKTLLPKWLSSKEPTCQCRRHGLDPWVRKMSWNRKWQTTPAFLSGKSHGRRSYVGCSPWGCKRVGHNWATEHTHTHTHTHTHIHQDLESHMWAATELQSCPKNNDWAQDMNMNININKYLFNCTGERVLALTFLQ